jgi:hypothetical protein
MKKFILIPSLIVALICTLYLFTNAFKDNQSSAKEYVSIEKLLNEHKISLDIKGTGGHQENCIAFDIKNLTKDTIYLLIEQGRRFVSGDSDLQDILLVRKHEFAAPPLASIHRIGYGFCCEASMKSPGAGSLFKIGFMTPKEWIKVLDVINAYDFEAGAIQSAVWVLSDNHDISSVYSKNEENMKRLRTILAKVKGIEVPWYSVSYKQDTALVFTNQHLKVWGDIDYQIKHNSMVSVVVRSLDGMVMETLIEDMPVNPGFYTYKMELPIHDWPKGEYEINILDNSNLLIKKKFKF